MIRTSRSRLEIRQEPDRASSLAGAVLLAAGGLQVLLAVAGLVSEWALPSGRGYLAHALRLLASAAFAGSGWFFLRGRSRTVLDLDHRMVARYMGVGGRAVGGNRSWDLAEFAAVVLVRREHRRLLGGASARSEAVCLRRPDGSDLEVYWADGDGEEVAAKVAAFAGLPLIGARTP